MLTEPTVVGVLAGAVSVLAAAIAYLYRESANQARDREIRQAERVEEVLRAMGATLTQVVGTLTAMAESDKGIAAFVTELTILSRQGAGAGGKGQVP